MRIVSVILLAASVQAQQLDLTSLDKLAAKATEASHVTLDGPKLKLASQFLAGGDESQKSVQTLVSGLRGIFVRTFEFDKQGEYSLADLDPLRKQLATPGWSNIVNVKDRTESAEIWFFTKGDLLDGIAIIAAEPDEVAVVNIVGPIDITALSKLSGSFGIPDIAREIRKVQPKPAPKPHKEKAKDDE
jgi:hypothetical protein